MTESNELTTIEGGHLSSELVEVARGFLMAARSDATRRAYQSDLRTFERWCREHGRCPLPATSDTIALFVSARAQAGRKVSTITRACSAITEAHRAAGFESPCASTIVRQILRGMRRELGVAPEQKEALAVDDLRRMVQALSTGRLIGVRDRAILTVGFAGGFRRSELVALNWGDLTLVRDGFEVTLRWSKTDQEGESRRVGIPYGSNPASCPVRALGDWLEAAGLTDGPIFRPVNRHGQIAPHRLSDRAVARIVKRRAEAVGLDPKHFAGHSLRSGLATAAARAGKSEHSIMNQTGTPRAAHSADTSDAAHCSRTTPQVGSVCRPSTR